MPVAENTEAHPWARLGLTLGIVTAATFFSYVLFLCDRGIELTDEGFYLLWISQPGLFAASVSQFGFVWHPVFEFLGGDLVALRQANVLVTIAIGWAFFSLLLLARARPVGWPAALPWIGLGFIFSASGLVVFAMWLPTPNYNTLALQGLLVGGSGWALVQFGSSRAVYAGYLVLGVGAWLTWMAKPTTALAAGVVFLGALAARRQLAWRPAAAGVMAASVLLLLSALLIDASIAAFLTRLQLGAADMSLLESKHTLREMFRLSNSRLSRGEIASAGAAVALVFMVTCMTASPRALLRRSAEILVAGALAMILAGLGCYWAHRPAMLELLKLGPTSHVIYTEINGEWTNPFRLAPVQLLAWPAAALLVAALRRPPWKSWADLALAGCFLAVPYAYVFGSGNDYALKIGESAAFWCAAGLVLLTGPQSARPAWPQLLPICSAVLVGTMAVVALATELPYRQPQSLREHDVEARIGEARLLLPARTAGYFSDARAVLRENGFQRGDALLDLSGHSPTLAFAVGARPIGAAWLLGGYAGSEAFARSVLDRVPPTELRRAWVLIEPEGLIKLRADFLQDYGIDAEQDYVRVGSFELPPGEFSSAYRQYLLKPKRTNLPP